MSATAEKKGRTEPTVEDLLGPPTTLHGLLQSVEYVGEKSIEKVLKELGLAPGDPVTDEQRKRAENPPDGLRSIARARWVIEGKSSHQQAEEGRREREAKAAAEAGSNRSRGQSRRVAGSEQDAEAGRLGFEAAAAKGKPLSQRIRASEIQSIRKALRKLGELGDTPALLGFKSEAAMRRVVTGEAKTREELGEKFGVCRDWYSGVKTHQLWMRKAIAGAFGVYLQAKP